MWEAISANKIRSRILISVMGVVLVALGFAIGLTVDPNTGGAVGAVTALVLWLILLVVAVSQGDRILIATASALRPTITALKPW